MSSRTVRLFSMAAALAVVFAGCSLTETQPPPGNDTNQHADTGVDTELPDECDDGEQTGEQTDIDCGGPNCPPCETGSGCEDDSDCANDNCENGVCAEQGQTCSDGETPCPTGCTDLASDDQNCGGCGTSCADAEYCEDGTCQCDAACCSDDDCSGGQLCQEGSCQCPHDCCVDDDCSEGVCNSDGWTCVGCVDDSDCVNDWICQDQSCVECTDDSDCPDGTCHPTDQTCVQDCCDFIGGDVFTEVPDAYHTTDIAVTDGGDPAIVYADTDSAEGTIYYAERTGGDWSTEPIGDCNDYVMRLGIDLDDQGNPHIVTRQGGNWKYRYRDGSEWTAEDVWDESLYTDPTDIGVDDAGNVHIVGLDTGYENADLKYAVFESGGGVDRSNFQVSDEVSFGWMDFALTADGHPAVSMSTSGTSDHPIYTAVHDGNDWEMDDETVDYDEFIDRVHGFGVGPDGQLQVVHHESNLPHNGLERSTRQSGGWQSEHINSRERASQVAAVVDDRNDLHVTFGGGYQESIYFGYTRWNGSDWETYEIPSSLVERSFTSRIDVDGDYRPHIVVYDADRSTVTYLTLQD